LPDAVLLDWNMPVMDGYEFLEAVGRSEHARPIVIVLSGDKQPGAQARVRELGANEYIMKPFDKEIVEAKFQEVGLI
jgi:two-component system chemotaxis response regulator CheY